MSVEFQTDFYQRLERINKSVFLNRCLGQISVIAVNFSKERFVEKNWIDRTRQNWKPRSKPSRGSILVKSGRLKRSIRKIAQGNYYVLIGTDVPYAPIHNDGGRINKTVTVRAHTRTRQAQRTRNERGQFNRRGAGTTHQVKSFRRKMNINMPSRRFMGESAILNRRIERFLSRELDNEISNT